MDERINKYSTHSSRRSPASLLCFDNSLLRLSFRLRLSSIVPDVADSGGCGKKGRIAGSAKVRLTVMYDVPKIKTSDERHALSA